MDDAAKVGRLLKLAAELDSELAAVLYAGREHRVEDRDVRFDLKAASEHASALLRAMNRANATAMQKEAE